MNIDAHDDSFRWSTTSRIGDERMTIGRKKREDLLRQWPSNLIIEEPQTLMLTMIAFNG